MESPRNGNGGSRLEILKDLAVDSGAERIAAEARALCDRVREGIFYVACVGQFKRGKSTLLNALVGEPVLPVGLVPVTAVVTMLRHGAQRSARVRFASGDWQEIAPGEITRFVTEDQNPENRKGVSSVEVFLPSSLLATGMCLVDTPGISSVFFGNTEATRAFVPHIDAALVVLGADPPISADELALIQELGKQCANIFFVLNKTDRLTETEREQASRFTHRVLAERAKMDSPRLFLVSATERLSGQGPERDWSGLVDALVTLARQSGSDLVQGAEDREFFLLSGRLRRHIDEQRGALLRPVEESQRRIESLRACVREADRALSDLDPLFLAEQGRLSRIWDERREAFLKQALPAARDELSRSIRAETAFKGPALREQALLLADEICRKHLDQWRAEAQPAAEGLYVEAMQRFTNLVNGVLDRLVSFADPAVASLPRAVVAETGFTFRSRLYYRSFMAYSGQTPVRWCLDRLLPRERLLRTLDVQVGDYLSRVLSANANRLIGDFDDRVTESGRRLRARIRAALGEVMTQAEAALVRARECQAQGSQAVERQVARLDEIRGRLAMLDHPVAGSGRQAAGLRPE